MRATVIIAGVAAVVLCAVPAVQANETEQHEQVVKLLAQLKTQAETAKPAEHDVALPVATAGARGAQVRVGNRFAVIWPASTISPLTALVRNLDSELQTKPLAQLSPQVESFVATYPEYEGDPLLQELTTLLAKAAQNQAQ